MDSCTKSLKTNKDYQIIEEVIAVSKPVVLYASFVDEYSKVFVFRDDTKTGYNFVPKLQNPYIYKTKEYKSLEETIFEYSSPIFFGDQYKGSLIVGFSQDNMNYCINKEAAVIFKAIKYIAAISIFLSVLGTGLIVRLVIKPIKETDSLKDKFISNISHELRTPLFVIEGYCNLLIRKIKENYSCSQQIKGLNIIKKSAERLRRFIDNILDLTKLKSGNFDIDMTPIDINEAIKETADYFKSLALEQKKAFIFNMQDNIPNTRGDIKRIKQVIVNLLENAFKFTKSGDAITISSMMSPSYGNGYIEVWIADTGIGISKKN
ncbi:MAG: HAMP domain-containing histidine kinase, partial [Endomicrobium sp.]|nr:HAMP domain-containing histidine kinase [Endomicrobium sp.]